MKKDLDQISSNSDEFESNSPSGAVLQQKPQKPDRARREAIIFSSSRLPASTPA
jgi:hypothetical protein